MTLELTLRTNAANQLTVTLEGQPLADPTPLAELPALPALQAAPYDQGRALTRALGGETLLALLGSDPEQTLLHALARRYSQRTRVVTVVGTGVIGKTALAATFAERFGWRWAQS